MAVASVRCHLEYRYLRMTVLTLLTVSDRWGERVLGCWLTSVSKQNDHVGGDCADTAAGACTPSSVINPRRPCWDGKGWDFALVQKRLKCNTFFVQTKPALILNENDWSTELPTGIRPGHGTGRYAVFCICSHCDRSASRWCALDDF